MAVKPKQYIAHDSLILLFAFYSSPAGSAEYGVVFCVCVYVTLENILYFNLGQPEVK